MSPLGSVLSLKDSFSQRKVCTQIQSLAFSLLLRLCREMLPSPLSLYLRPFLCPLFELVDLCILGVILAFMFCDLTVMVMNTMLKAMNCLEASKTNVMLIQSTDLLASYLQAGWEQRACKMLRESWNHYNGRKASWKALEEQLRRLHEYAGIESELARSSWKNLGWGVMTWW